MKEVHLVLFALFLEACFSVIFIMKYIYEIIHIFTVAIDESEA